MFSFIKPFAGKIATAAFATVLMSSAASAITANFYDYRERENGLGYQYAEHYSVTTTDVLDVFDNVTFHFTDAEMWLDSVGGEARNISMYGDWTTRNPADPKADSNALREESFSLNITDASAATLLSGEGEYYNFDFMPLYTGGVDVWHTVFSLNEQSGVYADATDFVFLAVDFSLADYQIYSANGYDHTFTTSAKLYNTSVVTTAPELTPPAVPLPASGLLLVGAVAGIGALRRRKG